MYAYTSFLVLPVGLFVLWLADRHDARTAQARAQLAAPVDVDKFDRLAEYMLADDQFVELDRAWCEEFDIQWPVVAGSGSLPMISGGSSAEPGPFVRSQRRSHTRRRRGF